MLFRFSLYGFLKNLRLFEAFLVLALLDRGLDFFAIGTLVLVREMTLNVLEVPSGALADAVGRRRCMVFSMAAYVVGYVVLGFSENWWALAGGMVLAGAGDAFRTGTHKALIFAWLRQQDRVGEKTAVYGYTRSWSKIGSACSALLGGAVVFAGFGFETVFYASAVPAAVNLVNLATYPASLDAEIRSIAGERPRVWGNLVAALREVRESGRLRALVGGSAGIQGGYTVAKDYVQPVLFSLAALLPVFSGVSVEQRSGLVVGVVAAVLFLLAGVASRRAHRFEVRAGGADRAVRWLTLGFVVAYAALAALLFCELMWLAAALFVLLAVGQNLWRPIQVARFDAHATAARGSTILSVESQAKSLVVAAFAPLVGWLVDLATARTVDGDGIALWPVPLVAGGLTVLLARRDLR